jgi:EamA domain-containing membrane protein RarD
VTFLVPVFALFYGAVFLGESITQWMLICAAVIVCGVALSTGIVKRLPPQGLGISAVQPCVAERPRWRPPPR